MNDRSKDTLAEFLHKEIAALERLIGEGAPGQTNALRATAEKMRIALEELHVAEEELRQQNDELLATRDQLAAEHTRYRDLFDLAPDGYLVTDPRGVIREANRAAGELLDLPPGQLEGKPLAAFLPPGEERAFRLLLARTGRATRPLRWQLRFQPRSREAFPASVTLAAGRGSDGEPVRLRWLLRDVTEEALARDELAASRQRLEAHLDNSPLAVIEFDPEFRILRWSAGAERLFGWTAAEVAGRAIEELRWVHEEDAETVRRVSAALLDGTSPRNRLANRNYRKDGSVVHCEWYNSAIHDGQGRLTSIFSQVLDVTERIQAERALAESEARFRGTFDNAAVGMAHLSLEGRYLRVNDRLCAITGYSREELLQRTFQELTHPDDLEEDLRLGDRLRRGEIERYALEKRYLRKDGAPVWVQLHASTLRDRAGRALCYVSVIEDISERRRLQHELQDSWERYTLGESIAHFGTWERDLESGTAVWSPECFRMVGRDLDSGPPDLEEFLALLHPDDREAVRREVRQSLVQGRDLDVEYRAVRPDGEERIIHSVARPLRRAGGPARGLLGAMHDVTAQRKAEAELRESEQRLRTLADALPQLVWTARPDGSVDWCNTRLATEYTAISKDEGGCWDWPRLIHPEDRAPTQEAWGSAVAGRRVYQVEHRVQMADGSYRWHLTRAVPLVDEQGRVAKWFGTSTDIGALKEAEAEIRRARDEALAAATAKSQFLANMSHEIRTPMAGVLGMAEVLDGTALDPEQRECVDAIRLSGKLLLGIVNDILDLSKFEAGGVALDTVEFALRQALEDTVHLHGEAAHAKGLELVCRVGPGVPPRVRGDPGRLRQLLFNLVGNAVKFTERGHVAVRAGRLEGAAGRARLRVEVEDTGIGIPEDARESLFQAFAQGDASAARRFGGSGLGLAICKRLVEAMGGEIGFTSAPGQGSTFWFTMPLEGVSEPEGAQPCPELAGKRGLAVTPHPLARAVLLEKLGRLGVEVAAASGAAEALRLADEAAAQGRPFDLALVELDLPDGSGLLLAREFGRRVPEGAPRICMMAPFTARGVAAKAEQEDGLRFLIKPARERDLVRCLGVAAAPREARCALPPEREGRGRVLLAEDNPVTQMAMTRFLERLGCRVDALEDGAAAVEAALATPYDLVLMDWQMPGMDGLEATREIRRREAGGRRVPIVALTAHALGEHREQCLAAGMDDYLSKPVAFDDLARALDRWVGRGSEEAAAEAPAGLARVEQRLAEFSERLAPASLWGIVDLFLEQAPSRLAAVRAAVARQDAAAAAREAHSFRGTCCHLGTDRLTQVAAELESAAEGGELAGAEARVAELAEELERVRAFLEARRPG